MPLYPGLGLGLPQVEIFDKLVCKITVTNLTWVRSVSIGKTNVSQPFPTLPTAPSTSTKKLTSTLLLRSLAQCSLMRSHWVNRGKYFHGNLFSEIALCAPAGSDWGLSLVQSNSSNLQESIYLKLQSSGVHLPQAPIFRSPFTSSSSLERQPGRARVAPELGHARNFLLT